MILFLSLFFSVKSIYTDDKPVYCVYFWKGLSFLMTIIVPHCPGLSVYGRGVPSAVVELMVNGCIPILGVEKEGRREKKVLVKILSKGFRGGENRAKIPMKKIKKEELSMSSEKEELKKKLVKAYEKKLDEMLDEGYGNKTDKEGEKAEVRYVATTESREIGKQLYELAGRPTLEGTGEMGFIGDGAEWLDEIREEHFVKSTRILDYYHVSEYVGNLGKVYYGEEKGKEWIEEKLEQIKAGAVKDVEKSLGHMKAKTAEQREELEKTSRYLKNHEDHMKYDEYKRMGFHIGSGVIEVGQIRRVVFSGDIGRWQRPLLPRSASL